MSDLVDVSIELKNGSVYELTLNQWHIEDLVLFDCDGIITVEHQRPVYGEPELVPPYKPPIIGRKPEVHFFRGSEIAAVVFHTEDSE